MKLRLLSLGLLLLTTLAISVPAALGQETTTGTIEGTVSDQKDGSALPGVSVEVDSAQGKKLVTTDAGGNFRFLFLTPGTYTLRASLQGYNTVERPAIDVRLGSRVRIEVKLASGIKETIDVVAAAPIVDLSTTTTGASMSSELFQSVPVGRTFGETLAIAPGVVDSGIDDSNPSIGGASGLENTYVVDGVNIGNTGYGSAGSYSITYGSLGTGVNFDYIQEVQVKTGGYEPEYGEALGGFVNLVTKSGGNDLKGSAYTYWQPNAFEGDRKELDTTTASYARGTAEFDQSDFGVEMGGPLSKDKFFAYGSFNPTFEKFNRSTYGPVRDATGIDNELERERKIYNYAANVKWLANARHTLTASAFGDPSKGDMGPQLNSATQQLDPEQKYSELSYGGHNVVGRWNGELANNWFVEGSVAWHRDNFEETPLNPDVPGGVDRRTIPFVQVGGVGYLGQATSDNTQYRVKFSNFFNGGGEHNLRYGLEYQDIGFENTADYSGVKGLIFPTGESTAPLFGPTFTASSGYSYEIRSSNFRVTRVRVGDTNVQTDAKYLSFYAYDAWNLTKDLRVMAGIRYEQNELIGSASDYKWDGNWAPRFNATWDPTKDGKTKVGGSWGRFFGKIPNDLAVRALSTEVTPYLIYDRADWDVSDPNNPRLINPNAVPLFDTCFGCEPTVVEDDAKLTYQDEWTLSAERELMPYFNLGVTYINRRLGRTMEDVQFIPYSEYIATGNFGHYVITNPDEARLFPEPKRNYDAVTLSATKRMHDNWQMMASYTWSQLEGNYEGYFRRDNGQSDPYITSLYDFPYLADPDIFQYIIAGGPLPNNREHVFNLYGSYMWDMGLDLGVGMKVQSGMPLSAFGYLVGYGNSENLLGERGGLGTGDTGTSFDIHAGYAFKLGNSQKLQVLADVFNLFNSQDAVDYDLDQELGCSGPGCENPDFQKVLGYQAPRQIRLAARWMF